MERLTVRRLTIKYLNKLKTGVSVKEALDKLAEIEDAEEQGLLVRLPVPEGTTVYRIFYSQSKNKGTIADVTFTLRLYADLKKEWNKTVFPTYEKAWRKLEELVKDGKQNMQDM